MGKGLYRAHKESNKNKPKQPKHAGKKHRLREDGDRFNKHAVLRGMYD